MGTQLAVNDLRNRAVKGKEPLQSNSLDKKPTDSDWQSQRKLFAEASCIVHFTQ
jgi:hypothetical protein